MNKICIKCNLIKNIDLFKVCRGKSVGTCKKCANEIAKKWNKENKERRRLTNQAWNKENKRAYTLAQKYGITEECYIQMLQAQKFQCKVCTKHQSELKVRMYVDHCHSTGKVRGLLCHNCNSLLGHAKDNIEILQKAIDYLKKQ